jgi:hypothetical protein
VWRVRYIETPLHAIAFAMVAGVGQERGTPIGVVGSRGWLAYCYSELILVGGKGARHEQVHLS